MALGTSRSHSCSCRVSRPSMCPNHALSEQWVFAKNLLGNQEGWLFPTIQATKATKRGWSATFTEIAKRQGLETEWNNGGPKYTGHSARALGAVHLALAKVDCTMSRLSLSSKGGSLFRGTHIGRSAERRGGLQGSGP